MCKKSFPSQTTEVTYEQWKFIFFIICILLTKTSVTSKITHHLLPQPHDTFKSWNTVFELKCSITLLLSGHQKSAQVYWQTCGKFSEYNHIDKQMHTLPFWSQTRDVTHFFGGNLLIPQKTEHYKAPFLFSQWNIQYKTCFWSLLVCSFKIIYFQLFTFICQ